MAAVTEANTSDLSVKLKSGRSRSTDQIIPDTRSKISQQEPGIHIEFDQLLQDMIGDLTSAPQPVAIKLFSEEDVLLRHWAPAVGQAIAKINGVVDVLNGIENTISESAVLYKMKPQVTSRTGYTPEEVETDANAIVEGEPATTPLVVNNRAYTIRVRFPEQYRASVDAMNGTLLASAAGSTAARHKFGRCYRKRQKAVTGLHLPPNPSRVRRDMPDATKLVPEPDAGAPDRLLPVFLLRLFEFKNLSALAVILSSATLSTSGVFVALLLTGTTFNISSFMGLIMVVGIVSKNGILLLDADQNFERKVDRRNRRWSKPGDEGSVPSP